MMCKARPKPKLNNFVVRFRFDFARTCFSLALQFYDLLRGQELPTPRWKRRRMEQFQSIPEAGGNPRTPAPRGQKCRMSKTGNTALSTPQSTVLCPLQEKCTNWLLNFSFIHLIHAYVSPLKEKFVIVLCVCVEDIIGFWKTISNFCVPNDYCTEQLTDMFVFQN